MGRNRDQNLRRRELLLAAAFLDVDGPADVIDLAVTAYLEQLRETDDAYNTAVTALEAKSAQERTNVIRLHGDPS